MRFLPCKEQQTVWKHEVKIKVLFIERIITN